MTNAMLDDRIYIDDEEEQEAPKTQLEMLRERGLLGSPLDFSWNGKMHTCCGSPRAYYHRVGCKACGDGLNDELKDEKPRTLEVPKLKAGAWRITEEQARTMYDLYQRGPDGIPMSLEQIGKAYRRSRQAIYDIFHSRGWPLRSKPKKGLTVRNGVAFTFDGKGLLRGTLPGGRRVYLHRLVWEEANGPVPEGYVLHFKDGNYANVEISNLELVPKKEMAIRFNPEKRRDDKKAWASRRKKKRARAKKTDDEFDPYSEDDEI